MKCRPGFTHPIFYLVNRLTCILLLRAFSTASGHSSVPNRDAAESSSSCKFMKTNEKKNLTNNNHTNLLQPVHISYLALQLVHICYLASKISNKKCLWENISQIAI